MSFICTECLILRNGPQSKEGVCVKCIQKRDQSPQPVAGEASSPTELLNAIIEDINGMIKGRKEAHDRMDWPHKFLVAHEGIGLMKALEVIEAHRKDTCI